MKKFIISVLFLASIKNIYAIYISEIMYDPQGSDTGREWVEVYNDTDTPIDLTTWKFFESNTNHGISSYSGGNLISANSYAIIADVPLKFLTDNPSYTGVLYDSSFSLSNSGELIVLKDNNGTSIDSVNYLSTIGGNDDGSTLSLINNSWTRGQSTPGLVNIEMLVATSTPASSTITPVMSLPSPDVNLITGEDTRTLVAGADSSFIAKAVNSSGKPIDGLTYSWSFGDGGTRTGKNVSYHYQYPGFYIAVLEVNGDSYFAKTKMKVKVIAPNLSITNSGEGISGSFIDILNNEKEEVDLSDWTIRVDNSFYAIPKNTFLRALGETRISGNALSFATGTLKPDSVIKLLYPDHSEMLRFTSTTTSTEKIIAQGTSSNNTKVYRPIKNINAETFQKQVPEVKGVSTTTVVIKQEIVKQKDNRLVSWFRNLFKF